METTTGTKEEFDVVILTLPAPQVLQLAGDLPELIKNQPDLRTGFEAVKFSSRYVLALYFNSGDGQHEPWAAKYIDGHPIFRYVSIDNRKRNRPEQPPAAVFHTSIQYGEENLEKTLIEMEPVLLAEYEKLFKAWPKPAAVKCHKWRYSQVSVVPLSFIFILYWFQVLKLTFVSQCRSQHVFLEKVDVQLFLINHSS